MARVMGTVDRVPLGWFSIDDNWILKNIRVACYIKGVPTGYEFLKIEVCSDQNGTVSIFDSDTIRLNDVLITGNQIGWLNFPVSKHNVSKNGIYYPYITHTGYVRNTNNFYISFLKDFPIQIYSTENDVIDTPIQMILYGYKYGQRI